MQKTLFPNYSIGEDVYLEIPSVCQNYGKTAVIIGGKHALAAAEESIRTACEHSSITITATFWYGGEASVENINTLLAQPEVQAADMLFAVGGGKAMDTVKVTAHRLNRPFFTFPTIASTCAACTSLGILYYPDGSLREYSFSKIPPNHIFIHTQIIAESPRQYLWAGIGDTMAKYFECTVSSRGDIPCHSDAMGIALSSMCATPVIRWGKVALECCDRNESTQELTEVILAIIISTGLVSNFVQVDYTTGLAHAVYNGFTVLPQIEQHHHLHGEIVSYGILVLLTVDQQWEERDRIFAFNQSIGLPTKLSDLHVSTHEIGMVAKKALQGIDVRKYPYEVTKEMICCAILALEEYNKSR